jgi:hypothetical protein
MDNSREPQYDYFCNSGEYFTLEESKLPVEKSLKKLKEFINKIITLTDSKRK